MHKILSFMLFGQLLKVVFCDQNLIEMRYAELLLPWIKFVIIVVFKISQIYGLSCSEILEMPADHTLSLTELLTVPPKEIEECLAHLSKEPLGTQEANHIWQSIITTYAGITNIPEKVLMTLHYVTAAVKPEDYANLTLSSIDVIENFGLDYNLDQAQLAAIADRVREDFAGKKPEDYTFYDLLALKQILCQFNKSEIERIHPSAYREAALTLGKLNKCSSEAMSGFATLAMQSSAFGPSSQWTETIVNILGKVADFLPPQIIRKIKKESKKKPT